MSERIPQRGYPNDQQMKGVHLTLSVFRDMPSKASVRYVTLPPGTGASVTAILWMRM